MKPIATDTYNFEQLINDGYIYVDKTAQLYRLANKSIGKQFFLSRPRRFGKSLLVSTFKSLFEGKRELFKDLAIDSLDFEWKKYPVLHLDMGSMQAPNVEEFREKLVDQLQTHAKAFEIDLKSSSVPSILFTHLCDALAAKSPYGQFVLLVDEYDKPLLGALNTPEVVKFRDELKSFYSVIKTKEALQRFTFITGISKFSKVSIFSDLNNLIDISMSADFATLLGYTHDEVKRFFPDWIANLAKALGVSDENAFSEVIRWYDGYKFEENAEPVINPVSLGLCLRDSKFKTYWSETVVPTFLVDLLKHNPINLQISDVEEEALGAYEPENPNVVTLLFQTGYLTIKGFHDYGGWRTYSLGFPNKEVRNSFNARLAKAYVGDGSSISSAQMKCLRALVAGDLETFFGSMKIFFANIPYDISARAPEETYQAIFCSILYFIGVGVTPEVHTNEGRIDAVMETSDHVYVMEFKRNQSAAAALAQIKDRKCYEKFLGNGKKITLIGVNFDSEKRTIAEWVMERLEAAQ
jgi:hypothetical protein